jgi:hypothetical protein
MGGGVAKRGEPPIAEVWGDRALIVLDDLGRGFLVGTAHGAPVFGVELVGELRGAHEGTEQHGNLAAFGLGQLWDRWAGSRRGRLGNLGREWRCSLGSTRGCASRACRTTRPPEHGPVVVHRHLVDLKECDLQVIEGGIIQTTLAFQGPIRDAVSALEQVDNVIEDRRKVHPVPSLPEHREDAEESAGVERSVKSWGARRVQGA